jgi:hypothetical protein
MALLEYPEAVAMAFTVVAAEIGSGAVYLLAEVVGVEPSVV